jgi:hypothetical protein
MQWYQTARILGNNMNFQSFIKQGKVRRGEPDISMSKSLVKMSENHILFLKSLEITETSCNTIFTTYYEALREIIEAITIKYGYKVYSHEAFTFYLKEKLNETAVAEKFDRYRRLRNNVNYYGKPISTDETKIAKEDIQKIIQKLRTHL